MLLILGIAYLLEADIFTQISMDPGWCKCLWEYCMNFDASSNLDMPNRLDIFFPSYNRESLLGDNNTYIAGHFCYVE